MAVWQCGVVVVAWWAVWVDEHIIRCHEQFHMHGTGWNHRSLTYQPPPTNHHPPTTTHQRLATQSAADLRLDATVEAARSKEDERAAAATTGQGLIAKGTIVSKIKLAFHRLSVNATPTLRMRLTLTLISA